ADEEGAIPERNGLGPLATRRSRAGGAWLAGAPDQLYQSGSATRWVDGSATASAAAGSGVGLGPPSHTGLVAAGARDLGGRLARSTRRAGGGATGCPGAALPRRGAT